MSRLVALAQERPLIIFDTESTGPKPHEARIVEIGFIQILADGTRREWQHYVNPLMPIPHEATYGNGNPDEYPGHGITDAMVQGCQSCGRSREDHLLYGIGLDPHCSSGWEPWPTFGQLAPSLLRGFNASNLAGFNSRRYDVPLMAAEFARNGIVWDSSTVLQLDAFRLWQLISGRTLGDACETFLGRKHEGAHRALDDVRATVEILEAMLERFAHKLPQDLPGIHEKCWPRDPNAVDPDGKIMWKDGEAVMNFGKSWIGKSLRQMSKRDLGWIVSPACQGASPAVKKICADAMNGKFPVKETA